MADVRITRTGDRRVTTGGDLRVVTTGTGGSVVRGLGLLWDVDELVGGIVTKNFGLAWNVRTSASENPPTVVAVPTDAIIQATNASVTKVTRRVEILNNDFTSYYYDVPTVSGSVTLSMTSSERRTFELVIRKSDDDDSLDITSGKLWYDKIVRIYRGVETGAQTHEALLGTFLIDKISRTGESQSISLSGRDFTKKLLGSKFPFATYFPENEPVENIIQAVAINGGVKTLAMPLTGDNTGVELQVAAGDDRWKVISDLALSFDWELYFDAYGNLALTAFPDLDNDPVDYVFQTGAASNLTSYKKNLSDERIINDVVVIGSSSDSAVIIMARAQNTDPASPTSIPNLGERSEVIESASVTDQNQAQNMANRILSISGLESYEVPFGAIVLPWIDVGTIAQFVDPDPAAPGDPTRFLLTDIRVPLSLEPMTGTMRRLINIA